MFRCMRCGTEVDWNDWKTQLKDDDRLSWSGFTWGQELDWILSLISDVEVKKIVELLKAMDSLGDYSFFSGGHISFLINEFNKELMCRREGLDRLKMEKEEYDKSIKDMLEKDDDNGGGALEPDTSARDAGEIQASTTPAKPVEEEGEWV